MKKTAILLTLTIMVPSVLPVIALAANENEATVTVTYTKDAPPPAPDPDPPATPPATYEINIPATVTIDNPFGFTEFLITASNVSLSDGQSVVVYIDNDSFSDGEYLHKKTATMI